MHEALAGISFGFSNRRLLLFHDQVEVGRRVANHYSLKLIFLSLDFLGVVFQMLNMLVGLLEEIVISEGLGRRPRKFRLGFYFLRLSNGNFLHIELLLLQTTECFPRGTWLFKFVRSSLGNQDR
jgi:hypothetical protein